MGTDRVSGVSGSLLQSTTREVRKSLVNIKYLVSLRRDVWVVLPIVTLLSIKVHNLSYVSLTVRQWNDRTCTHFERVGDDVDLYTVGHYTVKV